MTAPNPSILKRLDKPLGTSVEGQEISATFFLPAGEITSLDTLFIGAFHGDEGISTQLLEKLLSHIEANGLDVLTINKPFAIITCLNPDGLKNDTRLNANGVDLNRNYPTKDWIEQEKNTNYYSGPAAASEPETQVMLKILEEFKPKKIISVHAPYKVINYDGPAQGLAEAMSKHSSYEVKADIGYATPGSFGTYVGKERNIPTITLELPEDESLEQVWRDNRDALLEAITFSV